MNKRKNRVMYIFPLLCIILSIFIPNFRYAFYASALLASFALFHFCESFCGYSKEHPKGKTYRMLVVVGIVISFLFLLIQYGLENNRLLEGEKDDYFGIVYVLFLLIYGFVSPKIPYNRCLGLRLPWTLKDEKTWRYAQRISGFCAFPAALLCVYGILFQVPTIYPMSLLGWVLIPSIASYFYAKKQGGMKNE